MERLSGSRRTFIKTVGLLTVSAGLLWRYLTPRSAERRNLVVKVSSADVPVEGALVYREARVAVMRAEKTVYALGLVCTHLGCTVTVTDDGLSCPCHGSRFDRQGRVVKGPADRPLQRMTVVERDGMIEVYRL
jgi:Rieske Fe-S protein